MRLRGGVDADMVAKGALGLTTANAIVMALSPDKAAEIYEVGATSEADSMIIEYMGGIMLSTAVSIYYVMQGTDVATAVGYGLVPSLIQNVKSLLNGDSAKFGQEGVATLINPALTAFMVYTLLGSGSPVDADTAMKAWAGWCALNGAGMYFATDKLMEAWGAGGAKVNAVFMKGMGSFLASNAVATYCLATGEGALKSLGYSTAVVLAQMIDGNFITKDAPGSENAQKFWMAINAAVVYFMGVLPF